MLPEDLDPDIVADIRLDIKRYMDMGWYWTIISKVINRKYNSDFLVKDLKEICSDFLSNEYK